MRIGTLTKDDADRRDFDVRFDRWLPEGDLIVDAEANIQGDNNGATPLTIETITIDTDSKIVKVWMAGGVAGETHRIEVTVTTQEGRIKTACFNLRITSC